MNLQKLNKILRCIFSTIQQFLRLPTIDGDGAVPNGRDQSATDTPSSASLTENSKSIKIPQERSGARGKQTDRKLPNQDTIPPEAKPELICREVYAHNPWQILLVISQEKNTKVSQGKSKLSLDNKGAYLLSNFTEEISLSRGDGDEIVELFDGENPLIFKLRKNWKGDGRLVKHMSDGYYVVFAPHNWRRKGTPPIESSECVDKQFSAHYFHVTSNDKQDGFEECGSFFSQKRFSLKGQTVYDDSDMGDLFVGATPELVEKNENWQDVPWIRVGEEGGGEWSENFKPNKKNLATVLGNREGWFYVRVYDDVKMIYGTDFRRLVHLEEILVNVKPHSPENIIVPTASGHVQVAIQFVGKIGVEKKNVNSHITMGDNNTAIISPAPNRDKTQWILTGDNGQVKVGIHLPRIWWRMDNAGDEVSEWRDTAFPMSRNQFYENRDALIIVRLPSAAKEICVGFDSFKQFDGARRYTVQRNHNDDTKQAEFKLRDFCNHTKISKHSSKESGLNIQCDTAEFAIIRISADAPLPKPKPKPDPVSPQQKVFRPATKNKRFSHAELDTVGLPIAEAKYLRIAIDRRRKTVHRANVEALQEKQGGNHAD